MWIMTTQGWKRIIATNVIQPPSEPEEKPQDRSFIGGASLRQPTDYAELAELSIW